MRCGPKTEETRFWCILNLQRYLLLFTRVRHCVVAKFSVMVPGSLLMRLVRMVAAVCSIMNYNRTTDVWDVAISCCVFCQSTPWIAHHKPKHYVTVFATALHSILVEQTVMSSLTVVCSILNVATINWINLVIAFTASSSAWTGTMLSGQSTDQTVWRCDTELKLPSWTVWRHTQLHPLFDVQFSSMRPVSIVRCVNQPYSSK